MPKVPAALVGDVQSAAEENASREFVALDDGVYTGRLASVKAGLTGAQSKNPGSPKWDIEFDQIRDLAGNKKGGRQFLTIPMSSEMSWKVAQFFAAFDVPSAGTDTDELINHRVRISVTQRPITQGKRSGQIGNNVDRVNPLVAGDAGFEDVQKLSARLGGGKAAAPVAAAPAATAPAAVPQTESLADIGDEAQQPTAAAASPVAGLQENPAGIDF